MRECNRKLKPCNKTVVRGVRAECRDPVCPRLLRRGAHAFPSGCMDKVESGQVSNYKYLSHQPMSAHVILRKVPASSKHHSFSEQANSCMSQGGVAHAQIVNMLAPF